ICRPSFVAERKLKSPLHSHPRHACPTNPFEKNSSRSAKRYQSQQDRRNAAVEVRELISGFSSQFDPARPCSRRDCGLQIEVSWFYAPLCDVLAVDDDPDRRE